MFCGSQRATALLQEALGMGRGEGEGRRGPHSITTAVTEVSTDDKAPEEQDVPQPGVSSRLPDQSVVGLKDRWC